jgi:uncharacterized protein YbcI
MKYPPMAMPGRPPERDDIGVLYGEVSRSLVQLHKECYGRGPTKARSFASGEVLVCVLEGGYHKAEQTLIKHGRQDVVAEQRAALQETLRHRFVSTVERITDRKVTSFVSATDDESEVTAEIFVLDEPLVDADHGSTSATG